ASPTLCVTAGHGELEIEKTTTDGLSRAAELLAVNGYKLQTLDVVQHPQIPSTCNGLLIPRPTAGLGPAEDAIVAYLKGGGRAIVLADPESTLDLTSILSPYGLRVEHG